MFRAATCRTERQAVRICQKDASQRWGTRLGTGFAKRFKNVTVVVAGWMDC